MIVPLYDPKVGKTDFLDDKHCSHIEKYIVALQAMDGLMGADIRTKLKSVSYTHFLQRFLRKIRVDNYAYSKDGRIEF